MFRILDRAGHIAGAQAARAGVDALRRAVDNRLDTLDIGLPRAVGAAVGVGDLDAEGNTLSANITFGHYWHLLCEY